MESHSFGASSNPDPGSGIPFVEEGCGIGTGTVRGHWPQGVKGLGVRRTWLPSVRAGLSV